MKLFAIKNETVILESQQPTIFNSMPLQFCLVYLVFRGEENEKHLLEWVSWWQNPTVYSLMIHLKSLNQILNIFFEIGLLPTTSNHLKIRLMPMFLRLQLFKLKIEVAWIVLLHKRRKIKTTEKNRVCKLKVKISRYYWWNFKVTEVVQSSSKSIQFVITWSSKM